MELGRASLEQTIKDNHYHYDILDVVRWLAEMVELGAYMQLKGYVHRDIKPDNIIVFGPRLQCKMGDFGLSCHVQRRPYYCSPRVIEVH